MTYTCTGDDNWTLHKFDGTNYCYLKVGASMHIHSAINQCDIRDSFLASIHSQQEQNYIFRKLQRETKSYYLQ